ncbi:hypothetical protein RB195_014717 [Necator americanus]
MDSIDEEYDGLVEHLHDCMRKAQSFETTKRHLSLKIVKLIRQRGAAGAAGKQELTSELARICRDRTKMTALRNPKGTTTESRRGMEKIIYDFYSVLFHSHAHFPLLHLREDRHVIPEVLPSEVRHAIMSVRNHTAPGPDRIRPELLKYPPPVLINTLARLFTRYLSECNVWASRQ